MKAARSAMTRKGPGDKKHHERAEIENGLLLRLAQEEAGGEPGKVVDFEEVGVVLVVEHDFDARQDARADDLVAFSGERRPQGPCCMAPRRRARPAASA